MFIAALFRLCCFQLFFVLLAFFSSFPFSCPVFLFLFVITFDSSFSVFMSFLLSFLSVLLSCFCLVFCSVTFRRGPPPRGIVLVVDGFLVFWLIFSEGAVSGGVMCVCDRWLFSANHCIAVCFRICFRTVAAAPVHDLRAAPHCCDVDGVSGTSRRLAGACCLCVSGVLLQSKQMRRYTFRQIDITPSLTFAHFSNTGLSGVVGSSVPKHSSLWPVVFQL